MALVTFREKADHVVNTLLKATREGTLKWTVESTDGARFGCYRTTARSRAFKAEYRTGSKAFSDVSIQVEGNWISLGFETGPAVELLDLLHKQELELLVEDIVAAARRRKGAAELCAI